jgi:SNF2 family DNA or RNA helicase
MARARLFDELVEAALADGEAPNRATRRALGMRSEPVRAFGVHSDSQTLRQHREKWSKSAVPRERSSAERRAERPARQSQGQSAVGDKGSRSAAAPATSSISGIPAQLARVPDLRPPPALFTPTHGFDWAKPALDACALALPGSLERAALAIAAAELGSMTKFDELLCLPTLNGVMAYHYQMDTVRRVLRSLRGRALLADEVGLGKTVEAIMVLAEYRLRRLVRRALVLAPPGLVNHWHCELLSKAGIEARTTSGPEIARDANAFWADEGVVVASLALARGPTHAPRVAAVKWDLVVIDEAHHLKNRATASHRLANALSTRFLLLLTATPIETDLEEIYNLVTLLRPGQFATPGAFRKRFVNGADPTSPRNRHELRHLLTEVMVRNTRAGSGLSLPPRFVTTVTIDPAPDDAAFYQAVVELLRDFSGDRGARLVAATLMLQAGSSIEAALGTLDTVLGGDKHTPEFRAACARLSQVGRDVRAVRRAPSRGGSGAGKFQTLVEIVRSHGQQALVFTRYRQSLEALSSELCAAGIRHVAFHGGMGVQAKQASLDRFRAGAPVLLATEVGGEGQNLQFCSLLINFDLPWNPMQIEQRIGRLHRMGQEREVRVFNLATRGTAEERLLDVLDRRLHLFELVVGEMDMVLGNLADERDLEDRILELYAETKSELELDSGFDRIADDLARARGLYERTRAFDAALFRDDYAS